MIIYDGKLDQKSCKEVFSETIEKICSEDRDVVYLDCDLMGSAGTYNFWKRNPAQAINCGVAEANMIGIAAGLSACGKKPYAHTFAPFASRRCYDQVFLSVAYAGNSLRLFGTDPGVTAAFNGGTHMAFEDIALMREIPFSTVIEVCDASSLEAVMRLVKEREGLTYVRTGRKNAPSIYSHDHEFTIGKSEVVREGEDVTVFACGLMVSEALAAASMLMEENISVRVVDMFTIKPVDAKMVIRCARESKMIVTAENHNITGGLGDAIGSVLLENRCSIPFAKIGVKESFGCVGPQDYLQKLFGLTAENITGIIRNVLKP